MNTSLVQTHRPGATGLRPPARVERIATIDTLRGLAALAVVLFHYVGLIPAMKVQVGGVGAAVVALTRYG